MSPATTPEFGKLQWGRDPRIAELRVSRSPGSYCGSLGPTPRALSGLIGCEMVFRDGQKVFLERRLPNVKAAADWLLSHRQP